MAELELLQLETRMLDNARSSSTTLTHDGQEWPLQSVGDDGDEGTEIKTTECYHPLQHLQFSKYINRTCRRVKSTVLKVSGTPGILSV